MGSHEISYRYNSEGLVNKITYSNGDAEEITYESGTGNYAWFTLPLEQVYRLPSGLGCLGKASSLPFYEKQEKNLNECVQKDKILPFGTCSFLLPFCHLPWSGITIVYLPA